MLSTGGDNALGGDDWDAAIATHIADTHLKPHGVDASRSPALRARLSALARSAKEQLSSADKIVLRLPVGGSAGGGVKFTLTRTEVERLATPLFQRCRLPVERACWQVRPPLLYLAVESSH